MIKKKILTPHLERSYYAIILTQNGFCKKYFVHRLITESFFENYNKERIKFKDGNKCNYHLSNLEIATKPIYQYSPSGNYIAVFNSTRELSEYLNKSNFSGYHIKDKLKHNINIVNAYGYQWSYEKCNNIGKRDFNIYYLNGINMYDLKGKYIRTFKTLTECSNELKLCKVSIYQCARLKTKTAGGYIFRYLSDEFPKNKNLIINRVYDGKIGKQHKRIGQYDLDGNLIQIYNKMSLIPKEYKIDYYKFSPRYKNQKKSNYKWKYID